MLRDSAGFWGQTWLLRAVQVLGDPPGCRGTDPGMWGPRWVLKEPPGCWGQSLGAGGSTWALGTSQLLKDHLGAEDSPWVLGEPTWVLEDPPGCWAQPLAAMGQLGTALPPPISIPAMPPLNLPIHPGGCATQHPPLHEDASLDGVNDAAKFGFLLCPSTLGPRLLGEGGRQPVPHLRGHRRVRAHLPQLILCVQHLPTGWQRGGVASGWASSPPPPPRVPLSPHGPLPAPRLVNVDSLQQRGGVLQIPLQLLHVHFTRLQLLHHVTQPAGSRAARYRPPPGMGVAPVGSRRGPQLPCRCMCPRTRPDTRGQHL